MRSEGTRLYLAAEFAILFFVIPLLLFSRVVPDRPIVAIALSAVGVLIALRRDPAFDKCCLYCQNRIRRSILRVVARAIVAVAGLAALVELCWPGHPFAWASGDRRVWLAVMILYPVLSVLPQELVYRTFFFHRYRSLLKSDRALILASAAAFAFAHLVFHNWIAVVLSFVGGLFFAFTYKQTRSLPLAWLEHAIVGNAIFTIGLGAYFTHVVH